MSEQDPFPKDAFGALVRHVPAYGRLAWRLAREPLLSKARKAAVAAAAGYLVSPVDAVPGVIPVVGQLDDIAVAIAAIRFALAGLDADRRRTHLAAVGLVEDDLARDLRATGAITAWLVRAGGRTTGRLARKGIAVGTRVGAQGASAAAHVAGRAADAARTNAPRLAGRAGGTIRSAARRLPLPRRGPAAGTDS